MRDYYDIKNVIADLNYEIENGRTTDIEYFENLRTIWIPMVGLFVQTWGEDLVPPDVRSALVNVQVNLEMTPHTWALYPIQN